jgi:hypothetical protein
MQCCRLHHRDIDLAIEGLLATPLVPCNSATRTLALSIREPPAAMHVVVCSVAAMVSPRCAARLDIAAPNLVASQLTIASQRTTLYRSTAAWHAVSQPAIALSITKVVMQWRSSHSHHQALAAELQRPSSASHAPVHHRVPASTKRRRPPSSGTARHRIIALQPDPQRRSTPSPRGVMATQTASQRTIALHR